MKESCIISQSNFERISMDSVGSAQWILELACEIAATALARAINTQNEMLDYGESQREIALRYLI